MDRNLMDVGLLTLNSLISLRKNKKCFIITESNKFFELALEEEIRIEKERLKEKYTEFFEEISKV